MSDFIYQAALWVVPMVLAITLHEIAHGYVALYLGDDTASRLGRLSLNPLRHVDRYGTIILPGILVISQLLTVGRVLFAFGWAKPVPVDPWRFRFPRQGMMLVAIAGPAMNFFLAWLAALALHPLEDPTATAIGMPEELLLRFILFNLVLGLFNLLPIPPLDGSKILFSLLPRSFHSVISFIEQYSLLFILVFIVFLADLLHPILAYLYYIITGLVI